MTSPLRNLSLTKPDGTLKTAEELQDEANALVRDARARADRMRAEIATNVVETTSRNQAATVSVNATGALQSLRLTDRVKGMGPAMIAESIMDAYQAAVRQAAARTAQITARELGDGRITRLMTELLPDFATSDGNA